MTRGKFITLEGIEGAGKSTVAAALAETLRARGIRVRQTREPGGTPLAERLRQLVLERGDESLSAEAETLLMFAARAIHLDNLVRPALERGEWVICDRFTDATRAYQGGGRGVDSRLIEQLANSVHRGLDPDLTLLLDLPVTMGLDRARSRRQAIGESVTDRFESETVKFFERVRASYLEIAHRDSRRYRVIDASANADTVRSAALLELQGLWS
jgi:dTMP kinase